MQYNQAGLEKKEYRALAGVQSEKNTIGPLFRHMRMDRSVHQDGLREKDDNGDYGYSWDTVCTCVIITTYAARAEHK